MRVISGSISGRFGKAMGSEKSLKNSGTNKSNALVSRHPASCLSSAERACPFLTRCCGYIHSQFARNPVNASRASDEITKKMGEFQNPSGKFPKEKSAHGHARKIATLEPWLMKKHFAAQPTRR
jgi:hypothetical protein